MVAEHQRRLVPILGELGAEPRELVGRQGAGVAATAGLVVGVDADDAQPLELTGEVGRLVAREELVVEAVVALPLTDAARGPRVTGVGAIVVAPASRSSRGDTCRSASSNWPALLRSTGTASAEMSPAARRKSAPSVFASWTSDSSITSG